MTRLEALQYIYNCAEPTRQRITEAFDKNTKEGKRVWQEDREAAHILRNMIAEEEAKHD